MKEKEVINMKIRKINNDIYHHGIKGQSWGVKNGPPYPLSENKKYVYYDDTMSRFKTQKKNNDLKNKRDIILESKKYQRFQPNNNTYNIDDRSTYVSFDKIDNLIYYEYAKQLLKMKGNDKIYKMQIVNSGKLKVASNDNVKNMLIDTINDDKQFKTAINNAIDRGVMDYTSKLNPGARRRNKIFNDAQKVIKKDVNEWSDKDKDTIFKAWNTSLTFAYDENKKNIDWNEYNKLYKKLKSEGYSAIWDVHDIEISNMHTSSPLIIFDKSNTELANSKEMSKKEITLGSELGQGIVAIRTIYRNADKGR